MPTKTPRPLHALLSPIRWLLLAVSAGAFFAAGPLGIPAARVILKPLPVLLLVSAVAGARRSGLARGVMVGLCLSALGDVLLELDLFLPGLLAFLGAHLAYLAAFLSDTRALALPRALPCAAWGAGLFAFLRPGLGPMTLPVLVYMTAICTMMWRAAARIRPDRPAAGAWAGMLGAVSFGLSDSLIALDRFGAPLPYAGAAVMMLYWAGQIGIAAAALDAGAPAVDGEQGAA